MEKLKLVHNLTKEGKIDEKSQFLGVELRDKNSRKKIIWIHAYLIGLSIASYHNRIKLKNSGNTLVIGSVGSGKSTIAKVCAAIDIALNGKKLTWNHIHWDTGYTVFLLKVDFLD